MNVALVHEWLVDLTGSEEVVAAIGELFPQAPLYTLFYHPPALKGTPFEHRTLHASWLQHWPGIHRYYRYLFPLFPRAVESLDLRPYEVILSSSHSFIKGLLRNADQLHICYCHTPIRYAWDLYHDYLETLSPVKRFLAARSLHKIRQWDLSTVYRVDHFIANSRYVARRIWKTYGRKATVIYPPVRTDRFPLTPQKDRYFVAVSRFVPYKRMDLVVAAFREMPDLRLVVVGDGPERARLHKLARGARNIEFTGRLDLAALREVLCRARALVFPALEDFGIVPVEAQACGTPVIAYGRGGARETVVDGQTGLFFEEQTPAAVREAVQRFLQREETFDPAAIRRNAERFSHEVFLQTYRKTVEAWIQEHRAWQRGERP